LSSFSGQHGSQRCFLSTRGLSATGSRGSTYSCGSPVVELNRAIAIAETEGPEAGLRIVDQLGLDDFRYLHSTRAELLRRLGRTDEARDAYRRARQLTDGADERRFLERRLTELASTTGSG
jgi:RNA polymerase sigma-70 factor (ECF subfamily)